MDSKNVRSYCYTNFLADYSIIAEVDFERVPDWLLARAMKYLTEMISRLGDVKDISQIGLGQFAVDGALIYVLDALILTSPNAVEIRHVPNVLCDPLMNVKKMIVDIDLYFKDKYVEGNPAKDAVLKQLYGPNADILESLNSERIERASTLTKIFPKNLSEFFEPKQSDEHKKKEAREKLGY